MDLRAALSLSPDLPHFDREVLLSHVTRKDRSFLIAHNEAILTVRQLKQYRSFLERAEKDEPIAYIIGEKEFYGRKFFVGSGVLIPRPETEIIVEHALEKISTFTDAKKKYAVIDVGTGSSAIITSIYLSLKAARRKKIDWYALEKESAALRYARKNMKGYSVDRTIRLEQSDLLAAAKEELSSHDEVFAIANLPYLSAGLYRSAAPNVRSYEPKSALVSGGDGLAHYRRLMKQLVGLKKQGVSVHFSFEISPEQAAPCFQWLSPLAFPQSLEITDDLAGKDRIISGTLA